MIKESEYRAAPAQYHLLRKNTRKGNNKLVSRIDKLKMFYFNALLFIEINPGHWSKRVIYADKRSV